MDWLLVLQGLAIGFALAAPVGPIAFLCVRRTMAEGRLSGLVSGGGAATADAIYGFAAAFGVSLLSDFLAAHGQGMRIVGGILLCLVGVRTFLTKPAMEKKTIRWHGLVGNYFSALLLTLTNPMTFVAFAAVFATIGAGGLRGILETAGTATAGVFLGSLLWWTVLVLGVNAVREKFTLQRLFLMDRIAGALITALGLVYLISSLQGARAGS
jgi:threonine/homoserine/homoserine lactone efflux protein